MTWKRRWCGYALILALGVGPPSSTVVSAADGPAPPKPLPPEIRAIFDKPLYKNASWGLQVVDLDNGRVVYELEPRRKFLTGSVRKLISVGLALDKLKPEYKFVTPIYYVGTVTNGVLEGYLALVASGDLAMGGRANPDGTLAFTNYDHNEANSLGNAELTKPDPLAGYAELARQVAAAGIRKVDGDVIINTGLFDSFNFRGEFDVRPIFVNDDVVDVAIEPGMVGEPAKVDWRPKSAAFLVEPSLAMSGAGSEPEIDLEPENPDCFGNLGCKGTISGKLPLGFTPPLTGKYPLIRTFRITQPQNYARTALIEALRKEGVAVSASPVAENATDVRSRRKVYPRNNKISELPSAPYAQYAKWILKVSYNIGADTSLVLYGLTQRARSMTSSLAAEAKTLAVEYEIEPRDYMFIDGSGGGRSAATPAAIVNFLRLTRTKKHFETYRDCLPILATDGSLAFVTDFIKDPTLAGAKGKVYAKTGTFLEGDDDGVLALRAQAFAGYIETKGGRHLAYALFVNDVAPVSGLDEVIQVFQDEGTISAILWREN